MPAGTQLAGKRVVAQLDGGRVRLRTVRRGQKGRGKGKAQKGRYRGDWREPKLLIAFEVDRRGEKVGKGRAVIDGTFAGPDEGMELMAMHLHRLGAAAAREVALVADGAPRVWDRSSVGRQAGRPRRRADRVVPWTGATRCTASGWRWRRACPRGSTGGPSRRCGSGSSKGTPAWPWASCGAWARGGGPRRR